MTYPKHLSFLFSIILPRIQRMLEFYMGTSLHQVGIFFKYIGLRQV
jgi:hypothetical protein